MAVPTPLTFVPGDQTAAAFQSGIGDPLEYLLSLLQADIQRVSAVSLTTYKLPSAAPKLPASAVLPVSSAG